MDSFLAGYAPKLALPVRSWVVIVQSFRGQQCDACSYMHPACRLWTDKDNRNLVESKYAWFLDTYDALPAEIARADASRLLYMHAFGGGCPTNTCRFPYLWQEHGL